MSDRCPESKKTVVFVNDCPLSKESWDKRSLLKNCSFTTEAICNYGKSLEYHCLLNAYRNESIEVCAPKTNIPSGTCPEYSINGERINGAFNCKEQLGPDCPSSQYSSNEVYNYSRCIVPDNTHTEENIANAAAVPFEAVITVSLVISFAFLVIIFYCLNKKCNFVSKCRGFFHRNCQFTAHSQRRNSNKSVDEETIPLNEVEDNETRILIVGKTGYGKSASANTILGSEKFQSCPSMSSTTRICEKGNCVKGQQSIAVVDTPGLFDTASGADGDELDLQKESMFHMLDPGPNVIIIVIPAKTFGPEDLYTLKKIEDYFGEEMYKYCFLLITHRDELEQNNVTVEQFMNGAPQPFHNFLTKIEKRVVAFDNTIKGRKNQDQVLNLIDKINENISHLPRSEKHYQRKKSDV